MFFTSSGLIGGRTMSLGKGIKLGFENKEIFF